MGKDEIRVTAGLAIIAGSFVVIGPIASPWNYVLAAALFAIGFATIYWTRLAHLLRVRQPAAMPVTPIDPRAAAREQRNAFVAQRNSAEVLAQGALGTNEVLDMSGNPPSKQIQIQHGGQTYILSISRHGGTGVWIYGDHPSIASIAVERFAHRGETICYRAKEGAWSNHFKHQ